MLHIDRPFSLWRLISSQTASRRSHVIGNGALFSPMNAERFRVWDATMRWQECVCIWPMLPRTTRGYFIRRLCNLQRLLAGPKTCSHNAPEARERLVNFETDLRAVFVRQLVP